MSSLTRPCPRIPIRPLVAKGIAATSAAPSKATIAPARTLPACSPPRPKITKQPTRATPVTTAAVTARPGSFTATPQITSSADRPVAGTAAECRGSPAIAMTAAPSRSEATTISAPASRAESIAGS
jgi:hypothetical protein